MNLNIDAIADHIIWYSSMLKKQLGDDNYELMTSGQLSRYIYLTEVAYMQKHNGEPLFDKTYEAWSQGPHLDNDFLYRFLFHGTPILSSHRNDKLPADVMATIFAIVQTCGEIFYPDLNEFVTSTDKAYQNAFKSGDFENDKPGIITKEAMYSFYENQPPVIQSLRKFAKKKNSFYDEFMTLRGTPGKADIIDKTFLHFFKEKHPDQDPVTYLNMMTDDLSLEDEMEDNH